MVAAIPFNPMPTTNAPSTFLIQSGGYMQGEYLDDPAVRYQMKGGVLAQTETLPMWGGVGINDTVLPNTGTNPPDSTQGPIISRATAISSTGAAGALTGFSVFNQMYGMVSTPQSPVPLAASGMQVGYFRLGSNMRVVVACSSLLSSLEGGSVTQQVSWDFSGQQLIPYIAAYVSATVASVTYNSTTGILALTFSVAPFGASIGSAANGIPIVISGTVGTGAGVASLNGTFPITSTGTSGTVINVQAPTGLTASGLSGSTLGAGGGALPCKIEEILAGNSITVNWNGTYATFNYAGTVAVITI